MSKKNSCNLINYLNAITFLEAVLLKLYRIIMKNKKIYRIIMNGKT